MDEKRKAEMLAKYRAMSPERKEKFWDFIFGDAEMDRIRDMTEEEVDAELRASGIDPEDVARRCKELAERLSKKYGNQQETEDANQ